EKLAVPHHWVSMGQDSQSLWGECKGSAAQPYRTVIDLSEPAFKCTCPSRKFPCKHGLGLFIMAARKPDSIKSASAPEWVIDWITSRAQRAEKNAQPAEKQADPAAQAKRADQRQKKILNGLAELDLWLADLTRRGLATIQSQPYSFWEGIASRMVD